MPAKITSRSVWSSAAIVAGCILLVYLTRNSYGFYVVKLLAVNLIAVYGLNVVMGFAGQATVGHAALFGIGAYTSAILTSHGWPLPCAAGAAIALTLIAALFVAIPSFKLGGVFLAVLTIAFNIIVVQLIINLDTITQGSVGIPGIKPLLPASVPRVAQVLVLLLFVYIPLKANRNILKGFFVRELWALAENETLALSFGVNTYFTKVVAFEISAVFAGFAGVVYAHTICYISPETAGFFNSVLFVMMLIAGGIGTIVGPVIGSLIITIIPELMHGFDYFRQSVFGILLLLIALFFPTGVYGLLRQVGSGRQKKPQDSQVGAAPAASSAAPKGKEAGPLRKVRTFPGAAASEKGLLRVESATKRFGGVHALSDVSIEVDAGTIHAVIGPNGSGKTTMINVISGLLAPDRGDVIFHDESIVRLPMNERAKRGITRTFQNLNLLDQKTVLENVLLGLHPWWRGSLVDALFATRRGARAEQEKAELCYQTMGEVGISHLASTRVAELSYGQRKMVEMCRAIVSQPRLLLLDEPTSGLSQNEIVMFIALLRKLKESRLTMVLVEHHIDIVETISDRVTVLDEGDMICRGTYREIAGNPRVTEAYLGEEAYSLDDADTTVE